MLVVIVVLRAFSEISLQSERYNARGWMQEPRRPDCRGLEVTVRTFSRDRLVLDAGIYRPGVAVVTLEFGSR